MNEPPDELRDLSLRRELTPAERSRLEAETAGCPGDRQEAELDVALGRVLRRLPQAPVATNFTSRVMSEIALEQRRQQRRRTSGSVWPRLWRRWVPAAAATLIAVGGFAGWRWEKKRAAENYVREMAALRALSQLSPDVLQDFDAIQRFGDGSSPVDYELLAALQ